MLAVSSILFFYLGAPFSSAGTQASIFRRTPGCLCLAFLGFTKGLQRGVTGSHMCWADRHCWISQRKGNVRLKKRIGLSQCHIVLLGKL